MRLPVFIAARYLFAKKSHNVINLISAISVAGLAIGTAALIVILSVYNGFDGLVRTSLGNIEPDILVRPAKGKVFVPDSLMRAKISEEAAIESVCGILEDNVYIRYNGREAVALARGVDSTFEKVTPLRGKIAEGEFSLHKGDIPLAVAGYTLASSLSMSPRFVQGAELWYPDRNRQFSVSNPQASIRSVKVWPAGLFSTNTESDGELVIIPMEQMRELLGYDSEVSALEIRVVPGTDDQTLRRTIRRLDRALGDSYKAMDRYRQNETIYKMMRYEKAAVFLILLFVIIIVAFNIFGSLTMLIIEKEEDIRTFAALGADDALVRKIFIFEGWMISLIGLVAGAAAGIVLALVQQHFGIIKMPGSFIIDAYPVILKFSDVAATVAAVAAVGYLIALIPASTLRAGT